MKQIRLDRWLITECRTVSTDVLKWVFESSDMNIYVRWPLGDENTMFVQVETDERVEHESIPIENFQSWFGTMTGLDYKLVCDKLLTTLE
jgi:hypothetical protein